MKKSYTQIWYSQNAMRASYWKHICLLFGLIAVCLPLYYLQTKVIFFFVHALPTATLKKIEIPKWETETASKVGLCQTSRGVRGRGGFVLNMHV